jgi:riboflavin-specific deaminase-like protein
MAVRRCDSRRLSLRRFCSARVHRSCTFIASAILASMSSAPCSCMDQSTILKIKELVNQMKLWQEDFYSNMTKSRPFVTVTFAQSIDGYMALSGDQYHSSGDGHGRTSSNYPLSGDDSLLLTHALRSIHDGILIGGRTLAMDNPKLTNRLWMTPIAQEDSSGDQQPRPIVLDTNLRHIRSLGLSYNLQNPILCCSQNALMSLSRKSLPSDVSILPCLCSEDGSLSVVDVLKQLRDRFNIRNIMIEGGAETVSSFFRANTVDALVITIAPKLLHEGIAVKYNPGMKGQFTCDVVDFSQLGSKFIVFGSDTVLLSRYSDAVRTQT